MDVFFREDESSVRVGHAPDHLALLRKLAFNLLRQTKPKKCGAKVNRVLCAMGPQFLVRSASFLTLQLLFFTYKLFDIVFLL
ncbi:MAG: hypothetical protein BGO78_09185 [Chloroflexi bacterium 44-23]|nr:MAG: hypothetical protein BGO78_09185 [Chloroflexi bacterium 44-23]